MGTTLGWWSYRRGCIKFNFSTIPVFPMDWMGLTSFWRHFDVTLGWLWVYEGGLWSILGIKVVKERYMRVTLGLCWGHYGHMEVLLGHFGPLWGYSGAALSSLWGNLGVTFGVWRWLWEVFGSFWGHSELTLGLFLAYEDDFGLVIVSSLVYKGQFSKDNCFPNGS